MHLLVLLKFVIISVCQGLGSLLQNFFRIASPFLVRSSLLCMFSALCLFTVFVFYLCPCAGTCAVMSAGR